MDIQSVDVAPATDVVMENPVAQNVNSVNWLDSIKERFGSQEPWAVELVVFGLSGFIAGFLLKNFGKLAILMFLAVVAVVFGLHYAHISDVPYERFQEFFGLSQISSIQELINVKIDFCKEHPAALISGVVGLFAGWKVG